ncbi:hypothetical protein SPRG_00783 [Saprolegnia parasitica CBS 223.65]|uniref:Uncharacterized protein n=1 Tax=Saprolegnia parasitica (strain CBS 223.65) TaxID=695850 RepID=A0A067D7W8_SAPPC|nr:hypothetical protein SPRG_00783 [Saprolegnia parasitica CBS 223.65]KDO34721.1 hypothetical protein SPRG_00783 [Saprolegnia parasitica CBS 223.65]|eukprot:XP_012194390.1 hypothetical protein SPRG_00783 [Saprolegnia parasitica CBS 223.65]
MALITTYVSMWTAALLDYSAQWFPAPAVPAPPAPLPNASIALDMLCMCRSFATPQSHLADQLNRTQCAGLGFTDRWTIDTNMSHLSPSAPPVFVDGKELVVGGTLRAMVFTSSDTDAMVVAFRHQEGDGLLDSELWEAMGLFGRNFVQLSAPSMLTYGSLLDYASRYVQYLIFGARHVLGADFVPLAIAFTNEMRRTYPHRSLHFTGYSLGGALAQLAAIRFDAPATTFAANGILDLLHLYQLHPSNSVRTHVNYAHASDFVPKLDCQIGTLVLDPTTTGSDDPAATHKAFVYGPTAWTMLHSPLTATSGRLYSQDHGYCVDNAFAHAPGAASVLDGTLQRLSAHLVSTMLVACFAWWVVRRL